VVAAAFGDVEVADVFEGVDDRGADGGQVVRAVAGAAGGDVLPEGHVSDVVVHLDRPVLADESGQVIGAGLGGGEAGDDVDGLALDLPGALVLPPAGELDGLLDVGEVDAEPVDVDGLEGAGLDPAVPALAGGRPAGIRFQGRALTLA
jgi:hypothetical protein